MKIFRKSALILMLVCLALCCVSCGEDMTLYNTPVGGKELDKTNIEEVLENAITAEVYEKVVAAEDYAPVYKIIEAKEKGKKCTYYIVASVGGYSFENGLLTRTCGSNPFAAVIEIKKNKEGKFEITNYISNRSLQTPNEKLEFVKRNFPKEVDAKNVIEANREELSEMEKARIEKNGLIDKEFTFSEEFPELKLLPITAEAYSEVDNFFQIYPDWIGTVERKVDGERMVYETAYTPESEENQESGILSFIVYDSEGNEIDRTDIIVNGDEVELPNSLEGLESEDGTYEIIFDE